MVQTHQVHGGWVVSDAGGWLPGTYRTEDAALRAATVDPVTLGEIVDRVNYGEDRLVDLADLEQDGRAQ
jgi:hypothetical protein